MNANIQKAYQELVPSMIQVISQTVEANNETGARQLFDVIESLLILVRSFFSRLPQPDKSLLSRKFRSLANISLNWSTFFFWLVLIAQSIQSFVFLHSML
jgi:hypothetical protein